MPTYCRLSIVLVALLVLAAGCGQSATPTSIPPTATAVSPTATTMPPTATAMPPTATSLPSPTHTPLPQASPTATLTPEFPAASDTWRKFYGGNQNDVAWDVLLAEDGGLFIVGTTNLQFEPEMQGDVYLIRTDAAGEVLWEKTYGGTGYEDGSTIFQTNDGGLMIAAATSSFGAGGMDVYLIKLDQDGNEVWSKTYGGPLDEMAAARQRADGGYILYGNTVDPNDVVADPGAAGYGGFAGRSNVYLARTDAEGNELWTRTFGGQNNVLVSGGVQTPDGGFLVLASILRFPDPGDDIYLLQVDENGNEVWSRTWEEGTMNAYDLIQTSDGDYLITGLYMLGDDPASSNVDYLFIKVDPEGNEIWRRTFGDPDMIDCAQVLAEAPDGGYVAAGDWAKDQFSGDDDISLVKLDENGQLVWNKIVETNAHSMFGAMLAHPDGGYVIAGSTFRGRSFDIFVIKTDSEGNIGDTPETTLTPAPLPGPTGSGSATPPTQPPAYTPTFEEADCAFEVPEGYQPKCGYLIVPEDRSDPQGRQIRLHVAVLASTDASPAPDPVIHLAGGPGSSALAAALPILRKGGSEILKRRDYILFDQRGTQYSDPYLYCLPYDEYLWDAHELDLSLDEYYDGGLPKLAACIQDWQTQGINLAAYTSAESASDVNDLRLALGYDQVNLYGTSYGTRLALTVMRDHPEGIRSVILDSVYPPQVTLDLELAANANRSLQQVFQACASDDACADNYGDIEAEFYEVVARLEKAPVVVEVFGPYREQPYSVYLDGDLFIDAVFVSLYSTVSIADIPHFIRAAYEESYAELSEFVGGAIGSPASTGLFWSVTCGEEVPFEIDAPGPSDSAGVPLVLREHFSERYTLDVCAVWDVPPASAIENNAVLSDIPTLIFSGRYDPITPPRWAEDAAQTLSLHYFYEFPNMAHGVMRSNPCALQMGLAFLDDPLHAPESSCMEEAEGLQFH
jgi:pimeloyl-ACP methyl ester carboxylesterase